MLNWWRQNSASHEVQAPSSSRGFRKWPLESRLPSAVVKGTSASAPRGSLEEVQRTLCCLLSWCGPDVLDTAELSLAATLGAQFVTFLIYSSSWNYFLASTSVIFSDRDRSGLLFWVTAPSFVQILHPRISPSKSCHSVTQYYVNVPVVKIVNTK